MSTDIAKTEKKPITLRDRIEAAAPEFKKALPGHIPVEKFVRTVQTAVTMGQGIADACSSVAGLQSFMTACTKAATDGLILDGREAALVTFKGQVQYMPMVAGLMKKARNSGDISSLTAELVYSKDSFAYNPSSGDAPDHQPDWFGDRGEPVGVYAVAKLKDGNLVVEVMSRQQVMNIAAQSRNAGQYDPKGGKNYGEWWRKTVIRRISKYLPSSSDKDEFMQAVSRIDDGFDYDAKPDGTIEPAPQNTKRRGAAAEKLRNITPAPPTAPQPEPEPEPPHDPQTGEIYDGEIMGAEDQQAGDDI